MTNTLYIAITTVGFYIVLLIPLHTLADADMNKNNNISLDFAIKTTIQQNYTLKTIKEKVKIAHEELRSIPLLSNPEVDTEFIGGLHGEQNVEVTKSIELGGQRRHRKQIAMINLQIAEHQLTLERQRIIRSVKLAFYQLLSLQEKLKLVEEMIQHNQQIYEMAQFRHEAGDISITQVGLANLQLQSANREFTTLKNKQQLAQLDLNGLMGTSLTNSPVVIGKLQLTYSPDYKLDTLKSQAFIHRIELKSLKLQKQLTENVHKLAKAANIPELSIGGIVERNSDETGFGLKLSLPLPIFDRNRTGINVSKAQIKADDAQISELRTKISRDVISAFLSLDAAERNLKFYENDLLKLLNDNLNLTRSAYELGETGLLELIFIQNEYIKSKMDYLDTLYTYQKAYLDLEMAIGTSPESIQ
ncbi:TolC family protein [Candidatus Poribacteria bacterium]|nr:TolC family protein [Candidatus Poribacteria bacterium]